MRRQQPRIERRRMGFARGPVTDTGPHPAHRRRQGRRLRDPGGRGSAPCPPHLGIGEIIVGGRVEDDLRNQPVLHRDKTGIPVPLKSIKTVARYGVAAAIIAPQHGAGAFRVHDGASGSPVSGCIQTTCAR
jgi:hypothetical protein